jgi:hypothetical protein
LWKAFPLNPTGVPLRAGKAPVRTGNAPRMVRPAPLTPKRRGAAGRTPQPVGKVTQSPSAGGFHPGILFLVFGGFFTLAVVALLGVALGQLPRPRRVRRAGRPAVAPAKRSPLPVGRARRGFGRRPVPLADPPAEGALALGGEPGREAGNPLAGQRLAGAWSARGAASVATILTACLFAVAVGLFIGYYVG